MTGRFERQIPIFGEEGQRRIMSAKVGVAGCGGLGVNVITSLAMAGVCRFVLADHDVPQVTNLNRQFIYAAGDIRPKAVISAEWVLALNPCADVEAVSQPIDEVTASAFKGCDVIVDCLDSFQARMALNDYSVAEGIPLVHAGVTGTHGQVAVSIPGETPCLRCMLGTMADPEGPVPSVGAAVSAIAGVEALEALRVIAGMEPSSRGRIVAFDLESMSSESVEVIRDPDCPACGPR